MDDASYLMYSRAQIMAEKHVRSLSPDKQQEIREAAAFAASAIDHEAPGWAKQAYAILAIGYVLGMLEQDEIDKFLALSHLFIQLGIDLT